LPDRFRSYQAAKRRYYRWIENGVFDRLFEAAAGEPDLAWLMSHSATPPSKVRASSQPKRLQRPLGH
jgi:hypothetical protein